MPWTKITRRDYERRGRRYASDLTDREWELVAPFMPPPRRLGRPRRTNLRDVLDAILYMASTGCQWRFLPNDFPPPSTVQRYFYEWRDTGLLNRINQYLVAADITRRQHNRDHLRYPSDLMDREWAILAPLIPPAKSGGRPRKTDMREVVNAILYIAGSGCQWRALPKDFPPASTVRGYFYSWRDTGLWQTINHILVAATRELEGREASPTAGVIDSQSVKTTESGGTSGYDAGKKIKGRKRHIITDTLGLMLFVLVHAADIQDRDGAPDVLKAIRHRFPWLRHVFADGGYAGDKLRTALIGCGTWTIEIIKRSDAAKGFHVLPRRWVVERTFGWFGRCRRLAKDWEKSVESATAWVTIASIRVMTRRLATYCVIS